MTMIEKYRKIAEIEAEYNTECCGEMLTLDDQLCLAELEPDDSPWKALLIAEIHEKIAECMSKIQIVMGA